MEQATNGTLQPDCNCSTQFRVNLTFCLLSVTGNVIPHIPKGTFGGVPVPPELGNWELSSLMWNSAAAQQSHLCQLQKRKTKWDLGATITATNEWGG